MKCPYCAEEIKDEATFCRYCRHDLTFFKLISPLQDRISSLEDSVAEVSANLDETNAILDDLRSGSQAPIVASEQTSDEGRDSLLVAKDDLPMTTRILIVVLVGLIFSVYFLPLTFNAFTPYLFLILIVCLAAPVVGGGWVGTRWRGKHLRSYALLGFMAGIVATAVVVSVMAPLSTLPLWVLLGRVSIVAVLMVFSTTLLFVTGGLLGDRIEKRKSKVGKSERDAATQQHVQATARRITGSDEGQTYRAIVEILKVLQPFVPLITGLLGIIGPILLFLLQIQ